MCVCTGGPPFSLSKYSSIRARNLVIIKYHLKEAKNVSLLAYFLSRNRQQRSYLIIFKSWQEWGFLWLCKSVKEASLG